MKLYAVVNTSSYPIQCITVSDSKARADAIAAHVIASIPHLRGVVYVEKTDSFYPSHVTEPDSAIADCVAAYPLKPHAVFDAFWATALEDAQYDENDIACEEGREPRDIDGEPAQEYAESYRAAIVAVCKEAAPLIAAQNLNTFPRRCPDGDLDSVFGSDLYLTAAGHGAGFWDGDWAPVGDELTRIVERHAPSGSLAGHINGGLFFI